MEPRPEWYNGILISRVTELQYSEMLRYVSENRGTRIIYSCGSPSKYSYDIHRLFDSFEDAVRFTDQHKLRATVTIKAFLVRPVISKPSEMQSAIAKATNIPGITTVNPIQQQSSQQTPEVGQFI